MSNQLTFEVLIKTTLERAGVQAGRDEIKQLTETVKAAAASSKDYQFSADGVVEALTKQRAATASAGTEWGKMNESQKESMRDAAKLAVKQIESAEAAKKAASGAGDLKKQLTGLKEAGTGANQVLTGLNQGGIGGLITAGRGAITVVKSLATGALGGVLLPVVAAATAGMYLLGKAAKQNAADMEQAFDAAAKSREDYAARVEATSARVKKALDEELKSVESLARAAEEGRARQAKAYGRDEALDPARKKVRDEQLNLEEQKALAKAKSPADVAAVKKKFSDLRSRNEIRDEVNDINSDDLRADNTIRKEQANIRDAGQLVRNAEAQLRDAQIAAEEAMREASSFKRKDTGRVDADGKRIFIDDTSPAAKAARNKARDAQAAVKGFEKNLEEVQSNAGEIIKSSQEEIDAATLTKEETALRRQVYQSIINQKAMAAETPKEKEAILAAAADLSASPAAAEPVGNILGEMTTKDGKKIIAQRVTPTAGGKGSGGTIEMGGKRIEVGGDRTVESLAKVGAVLGKTLSAIENFSTKVSKDAEKVNRKIKQNAQAGPGGG